MRRRTSVPDRVPPPHVGGHSLLAAINDHYAEIGHEFLGADVEVGIAQCGDANDVGFADLAEERRDELVEFVMADFNAVSVFDRLDFDFSIGVLDCSDVQWGEGFFDEGVYAGGGSQSLGVTVEVTRLA